MRFLVARAVVVGNVVRGIAGGVAVGCVLGHADIAWTTVRAAEVVRTAVTVRVYQSADLPVAIEASALAEAKATLKAALVDVRWIHCPSGARRPVSSSCGVPPGPGELSVRLVRTGPGASRAGATPLGDALVGSERGPGALATVYVDRVLELAAAASGDAQALLGRTIAHELGHLLMASNGHARTGLMRPNWTSDEIRRARAADWTFASAEVAAIRTRSTKF